MDVCFCNVIAFCDVISLCRPSKIENMSEFSVGLAKALIVVANQKDHLSASNVIFLLAFFLCLSNNKHWSYTFP